MLASSATVWNASCARDIQDFVEDNKLDDPRKQVWSPRQSSRQVRCSYWYPKRVHLYDACSGCKQDGPQLEVQGLGIQR